MRKKKVFIGAAAVFLAAAMAAAGTLSLLKMRSMYQSVQNNVNKSRKEVLDSVLTLENTVNALEAQMKLAAPDLYQQTPLRYDWVKEDLLIAHALGGVTLDGYSYEYTNSQEAFRENYDKGIRVFEADFQLTTDGGLVCVHDWDRYDGPLSFADFQQGSFYDGRITQLTGADLIDLMIRYPDIYVVTDTKYTDVNSVRLEFSQLLYLAEERGERQVLDRLIVQVYNQGMYDVVYEIYPWKSVIYTLYQSPDDFESVLQFCIQRGIRAVTMSYGSASQDYVSRLHEAGIHTFAFTVNDMDQVNQGREIGITGYYTDTLSPEDMG